MPNNNKQLVWDSFRCPFCGGEAIMGLMSLIAYCEDCGSRNYEYTAGPTEWRLETSEGSD